MGTDMTRAEEEEKRKKKTVVKVKTKRREAFMGRKRRKL